MNFRIVRLDDLSGAKATIYSAILEEDEKDQMSLFDRFLAENSTAFRDEINNILSRIKTIADKTGSRDHFFKRWEGNPGDGVCALYDDPERRLRLYCIRFGTTVLILGGGGDKPKPMKALQESEKLEYENKLVRIISSKLAEKISEKEIYWSDDQVELLGDFNFYENE